MQALFQLIASAVSTVFKSIASTLLLVLLALRLTANTFYQQLPMDEEDGAVVEEGETYQYPSVDDVLAVKNILMQVSKMPLELVDLVVDWAEYWPHTTVDTQTNKLRRPVARGGPNENIFMIRSLPIGIFPEQLDSESRSAIVDEFVARKPQPVAVCPEPIEKLAKSWASSTPPRGRNPCRKIVFTIISHDQGWGGNFEDRGTFRGSYTWFDVGLERIEARKESSTQFNETGQAFSRNPGDSEPLYVLRTLIPTPKENDTELFDHPFLAPDTHIIRNRTATKAAQEHVVTWSCTDNVTAHSPAALELTNAGRGDASGNGEFVRNLQVGDIVTVWSRARFGGWQNWVERCKIDVYWAV